MDSTACDPLSLSTAAAPCFGSRMSQVRILSPRLVFWLGFRYLVFSRRSRLHLICTAGGGGGLERADELPAALRARWTYRWVVTMLEWPLDLDLAQGHARHGELRAEGVPHVVVTELAWTRPPAG